MGEKQIEAANLMPSIRSGDVLQSRHALAFVDHGAADDPAAFIGGEQANVFGKEPAQSFNFTKRVHRPRIVGSGQADAEDVPERAPTRTFLDADAGAACRFHTA